MATYPSSPAAASPGSTASVLEYICLFTRDLVRKQKRWTDGRLKYHTYNKRVMVYDERGNFIGDMHWNEDNEFGEGEEFQLERGSAIVQVSECIGRKEQDLSELVDKRIQERTQRAAQVAARTPAPSAMGVGSHPVVRQVPADNFQLRHRPLNQLLGTPSGHHGRAVVPFESPFEQRQRDAAASDDGTPRPANKRRRLSPPPSKAGYAQNLFGTKLCLSSQPMSSVSQWQKPNRVIPPLHHPPQLSRPQTAAYSSSRLPAQPSRPDGNGKPKNVIELDKENDEPELDAEEEQYVERVLDKMPPTKKKETLQKKRPEKRQAPQPNPVNIIDSDSETTIKLPRPNTPAQAQSKHHTKASKPSKEATSTKRQDGVLSSSRTPEIEEVEQARSPSPPTNLPKLKVKAKATKEPKPKSSKAASTGKAAKPAKAVPREEAEVGLPKEPRERTALRIKPRKKRGLLMLSERKQPTEERTQLDSDRLTDDSTPTLDLNIHRSTSDCTNMFDDNQFDDAIPLPRKQTSSRQTTRSSRTAKTTRVSEDSTTVFGVQKPSKNQTNKRQRILSPSPNLLSGNDIDESGISTYTTATRLEAKRRKKSPNRSVSEVTPSNHPPPLQSDDLAAEVLEAEAFDQANQFMEDYPDPEDEMMPPPPPSPPMSKMVPKPKDHMGGTHKKKQIASVAPDEYPPSSEPPKGLRLAKIKNSVRSREVIGYIFDSPFATSFGPAQVTPIPRDTSMPDAATGKPRAEQTLASSRRDPSPEAPARGLRQNLAKKSDEDTSKSSAVTRPTFDGSLAPSRDLVSFLPTSWDKSVADAAGGVVCDERPVAAAPSSRGFAPPRNKSMSDAAPEDVGDERPVVASRRDTSFGRDSGVNQQRLATAKQSNNAMSAEQVKHSPEITAPGSTTAHAPIMSGFGQSKAVRQGPSELLAAGDPSVLKPIDSDLPKVQTVALVPDGKEKNKEEGKKAETRSLAPLPAPRATINSLQQPHRQGSLRRHHTTIISANNGLSKEAFHAPTLSRGNSLPPPDRQPETAVSIQQSLAVGPAAETPEFMKPPMAAGCVAGTTFEPTALTTAKSTTEPTGATKAQDQTSIAAEPAAVAKPHPKAPAPPKAQAPAVATMATTKIPTSAALTATGRPRIANPATRGRKAATKADAQGQVPQHVLPPNIVGSSLLSSMPKEVVQAAMEAAARAEATALLQAQRRAAQESEAARPKIKMRLPGFQSAGSATGPWSKEAFDLLGMDRPGG